MSPSQGSKTPSNEPTLSAGTRVVVWALAAAFLATVFSTAGLHPLTALGASAFFAAILLPIGFVATGGRLSAGLSRGENALLAALTGYALSAALVFFGGASGLGALVLPALLCLGPAVLIVALRTRGDSLTARPAPSVHWTLAIVLPAVVFAVIGGNPPITREGDTVRYVRTPDGLVHASYYWELSRGVPPAELPSVAGVPFPRYHILGYLPPLLAARAGLVDPVTLSQTVAPLFCLAAFLGAAYVALRLWSGDTRAAVAILALAAILGLCVEGLLRGQIVQMRRPSLVYLVWSESGGPALMIWATIFALLALQDQQPQDRVRVPTLAALLAGLSIGFKVHLFLLFGGAYLVATALIALRERSWRLLALASLTALIALGLAIAWSPAGRYGSVQFTPGALVRELILPRLHRDGASLWQHGLARLGETLPAGARDGLFTLLAVWRVALFSPVIPVFVCRTLRRWRGASYLELTAALAHPVALLAFGFLGVADGESNGPFFRQMGHGISLLSATITVAWVYAAWRRRTPGLASRRFLFGALATCVAVCPWLPRPERQQGGPVLEVGERCALAYLRSQVPLDAVVLSADSCGHVSAYPEVAGLAGRRSVLEYFGDGPDPGNHRTRDVEQFYATLDAGVAFDILERYRVDYVFERPAHALAFPKHRLKAVFEREGFRVYSTGRPAAARTVAAAPPLLPGLAGLDCRGWP